MRPRDHAGLLADLAALTADLRAYRDSLAQRPLPHAYQDDAMPALPDEVAGGRLPRRAPYRPGPARPVGMTPGWTLPLAAHEAASDSEVLALPQPDWLEHALTVSGPDKTVTRFRQAAAGPGVIPWSDDLLLTEDWADRLVRDDPLPGARTEAQGIVDRITGLCCPLDTTVSFDLHALVPVPDAVLALGPQDPVARAWLWTHWGTTQPLRRITPLAVRDDPGTWVLGFWSADWTPWRALTRIQQDWPALTLAVRPLYEP